MYPAVQEGLARNRDIAESGGAHELGLYIYLDEDVNMLTIEKDAQCGGLAPIGA